MKTSLLCFSLPSRRIGARSVLAAGMIIAAAVFGVQLTADAQTSGKVIKWDQPPVLASPTNVYYGWNEPSIIGLQVAADDWVCGTTNPVMKIRWWGSFISWTSSDPTPVLPFDFKIHFWTDQPKGPGNPFSHPQQAIWQITCTNFTWRCVGKDYDPRTGTFESCFLFETVLRPQEWFYQDPLTGTNIYWISIAAEYPVGIPATHQFGWKTRLRNPASPAPDAAVDIFNPNNPFVGALFGNGAPLIWPNTNVLWDLAFELVTAGPATAKWEQLPDLTTTGMDVNATQQPQPQQPFLLADDFLCTTPGYITNIVIWGSWTNDQLPINAVGFPNATNVTFLLSIHDDIPAAQSPTGYSMPGALRWLGTAGPNKFIHSVTAANIQEGWLTPPANYAFPGDTVCHQYEIRLTQQDEPFFQDGTPSNPKVFWLDVQAVPALSTDVARFGWKSSVTNWNDAAVWANATEPFGGIWNKLVYPPGHPKSGTNVHMAFRINTGGVTSDSLKWSQPPILATNPGTWYNGWNEPSIDNGGIWNNTLLTNIVADDWLCINPRPVSDFHWWGSFLDWTGTNPPSDSLLGFHLAIWTDVPTNVDLHFSRPGQVLWDYVVSTTDLGLQWSWVGWDLDPRTQCLDTETCFKFDYSLPSTNLWFYQQPGTNIYWLSISAIYPSGYPIQYPFGWKTRPHVPVPPDDAVRIFNPLHPTVGGFYGIGEPIEFPTGTSWDMAFQLTSCQQAPVTNIVFTNIVVTNFISSRQVTIRWNAQAGAVYQFQHALVLTNQPNVLWSNIGAPIVGPINTAVFTNSLDLLHFYRLYMPDICP